MKTTVRFGASAILALAAVLMGCKKTPTAAPVSDAPKAAPVSAVQVQVIAAGPLVVKTAVSEFDLTPHGYLQALLLRDGQRLTLDDP